MAKASFKDLPEAPCLEAGFCRCTQKPLRKLHNVRKQGTSLNIYLNISTNQLVTSSSGTRRGATPRRSRRRYLGLGRSILCILARFNEEIAKVDGNSHLTEELHDEMRTLRRNQTMFQRVVHKTLWRHVARCLCIKLRRIYGHISILVVSADH